jgi:hypothetical protein
MGILCGVPAAGTGKILYILVNFEYGRTKQMAQYLCLDQALVAGMVSIEHHNHSFDSC